VVQLRRHPDDDVSRLGDQPWPSAGPAAGGRFNVLLTEDRPHGVEHWTAQLPRLLEPQGVRSFVARCGEEAIDFATQMAIHAAVIDMATPLGRTSGPADAATAGQWVLELLRRMHSQPPVVVLRPRTVGRREADRMLQTALRMGAFSVMDKPIELEELLIVFRRLVDRRYGGGWPGDRSTHETTDRS